MAKKTIWCPFFEMFEVSCPYLTEDDLCDEFDVNPGNGDAWCLQMIEKGVKTQKGEEALAKR